MKNAYDWARETRNTSKNAVSFILEIQHDARVDLLIALEESVKLQSHYAKLLNMHDGGKRLEFKNALEMQEACMQAQAALERLAEVMKGRSGQPHKVRTLLYSMWNGKPAELNELLGLDWQIKKDLVAVMLAFGYEDSKVKFFYRAIETAIKNSGQWEWFLEERKNIRAMKEYIKAVKREEG
jgi:hypothetical protein